MDFTQITPTDVTTYYNTTEFQKQRRTKRNVSGWWTPNLGSHLFVIVKDDCSMTDTDATYQSRDD